MSPSTISVFLSPPVRLSVRSADVISWKACSKIGDQKNRSCSAYSPSRKPGQRKTISDPSSNWYYWRTGLLSSWRGWAKQKCKKTIYLWPSSPFSVAEKSNILSRRSCFSALKLFALLFLVSWIRRVKGHAVQALYRDRLMSVRQVWWILLLLLVITSDPTCLQHSRNLVHGL